MAAPRMQDDFYCSVNAKWLSENPCPADYSRWGTFEELMKVNEEQIRDILNTTEDASSEWEAVQILWNQGQNEDQLNSAKFSDVLAAHFDQLDKVTTIQDLTKVIIDWFRYGISTPLVFAPHPDLKDSDFMISYIDRSSGGLGLQDRDVYFDENMKDKREKYREYLTTLTVLIKSEVDRDYLGDIDDVYNLEVSLAESCLPKVDRREPYKMYNTYTVDKLSELCPVFDWNSVLADLELSLKPDEFLVVKEIEFMKKLNTCLETIPLSTWKHYLAIRLLSCLGKHLDDKTSQIRFDFYGKVMSGQQEQKPRWKRVYHVINSLVGEIVGKKYVAQYFPAESKDQVKDMIRRMMVVLEERIKNLPWMENETKQKALKKLSTFTVKIGYPDKWDDFSALHLDPSKPYCINVLSCDFIETKKELKKCYKQVDKTEWHLTPQTVNAYYNPSQNEIVFPAGIIQPPMYSKNASIASNFGGIGAVICHEITHGFDDKGAKFDHAGNLENWWTEKDEKSFQECSEKLKEHFSQYEVCGMKVKGDLCLGENIADLGGLSISLEALSKLMEERGESDEKRQEEMKNVFFAWAVIWRNNIKPEESKRRIIIDPHSPGNLRVNGIVKNINDFYDLFAVTEKDSMFLKPDLRSKIW